MKKIKKTVKLNKIKKGNNFPSLSDLNKLKEITIIKQKSLMEGNEKNVNSPSHSANGKFSQVPLLNKPLQIENVASLSQTSEKDFIVIANKNYYFPPLPNGKNNLNPDVQQIHQKEQLNQTYETIPDIQEINRPGQNTCSYENPRTPKSKEAAEILMEFGNQMDNQNEIQDEDMEGWTRSSAKKRRTSRQISDPVTASRDASLQRSRENRFKLLDNIVITSSKGKTDVNPNISPSNQSKPVNVVYNKSEQKFCPPIILYHANIKKLIDDLKNSLPDLQVKIININRSKSKLFVNDVEAHSRLLNMLREVKDVEAHSYTPKELKRVNLILRGLNSQYNVDEIKAEIEALAPNVVESVSKFETIRSKGEQIDYNLFLVKLLPNKQAQEVISIKYICYSKVKWEKPRGNRGVMQCRRCQAYGHLAKNCARNYNCVKCEGNHMPGECRLERTKDSIPYCVNCKKYDHPANFRGCPYYEGYMNKRKELIKNAMAKKENTKNFVQNTVNSPKFVDNSTLFTDLFKGNSPVSHSQNISLSPSAGGQNIIGEFFELSKQLFGTSITDLLTKIRNFMQNVKKYGSIEEKRLAYLGLLNEVLISNST